MKQMLQWLLWLSYDNQFEAPNNSCKEFHYKKTNNNLKNCLKNYVSAITYKILSTGGVQVGK